MRQRQTEIFAPSWQALCRAALIAILVGQAWTTQAADEVPRIVLCPGTQIVTAISDSTRDYESIKTIEQIDGSGMQLRYSSEAIVYDWLSPGPGEFKATLTRRMVRSADLENSSLFLQHFEEVLPEMVPETTAITISRGTFSKLKTEGQAEFAVFIPFNVDKPGIDREVHPNVYDNQMVTTVSRALSSPAMKVTVNGVERTLPTLSFTGDFFGDKAEFTVLDDHETPLMLAFRIGIGANAPLTADEVEQRKLLEMPTTRSPDKEVLRVVKIEGVCSPSVVAETPPPPAVPPAVTIPKPDVAPAPALTLPPVTDPAPATANPAPESPSAAIAEAPPSADPPPAPANSQPEKPQPLPPPVKLPETVAAESKRLEKAIADNGRVDIQAIFFSVNSATIRVESDPALRAIADVLGRHGDWQMSVEGHTDSQGEDAFNLDLSQRRAAAVKTALATRFGVDGSRLTTTGLGETKPVADNATLEGRARNRRVELVKR